jgi:hypothetical protein
MNPILTNKTKMKNVTIQRSKWYRGDKPQNGESKSKLWLNDKKGHGCCLGHVLNQTEGFNKKQMCNIGDPEDLALELNKPNNLCEVRMHNDIVEWADNHDWVRTAMVINDNGAISDKEREKQLKKLFKENGYNVKFVN